jgi:hypothetical protein
LPLLLCHGRRLRHRGADLLESGLQVVSAGSIGREWQ